MVKEKVLLPTPKIPAGISNGIKRQEKEAVCRFIPRSLLHVVLFPAEFLNQVLTIVIRQIMIRLACFYVKYKECKSLNTESRRYPTYQYIKFIWQKKIYLIGFTILCLVIGAAYSYTRGTSATTT